MLLAMKYKNLFTEEFQTKVYDIVFSFQTSASGPFLKLFPSGIYSRKSFGKWLQKKRSFPSLTGETGQTIKTAATATGQVSWRFRSIYASSFGRTVGDEFLHNNFPSLKFP
jgi:hypothetical protein